MAVADSLTYDLAPIMSPDLATFIDGVAAMFADAEYWSRDRTLDDGSELPGWAILFDVDNPDQTYAGLRWMAQLVGETVPQQVPLDLARQQIHDQPHKRRGTRDSIVNNARVTLTGAQTVILRERDATVTPGEPAYGLTVITYTDQTPDPAATEAAIRAVLPAGIVLNYETLGGWDIAEMEAAGFANIGALEAAHADIGALEAHE